MSDELCLCSFDIIFTIFLTQVIFMQGGHVTHEYVCCFFPRLCTRPTVDMRRRFEVGANVDKEGHACCDVKLVCGFIHIFFSSTTGMIGGPKDLIIISGLVVDG